MASGGARSAISRRIFVWTLPDNLAGDCCDDLHAVVQVAGLFKEQELCRKRKLPRLNCWANDCSYRGGQGLTFVNIDAHFWCDLVISCVLVVLWCWPLSAFERHKMLGGDADADLFTGSAGFMLLADRLQAGAIRHQQAVLGAGAEEGAAFDTGT